MDPEDCRDNVRFCLSDGTGALRFESFDIVDAPLCQQAAARLRQYLVGRRLADVDPTYITQLTRPGDGTCTKTIADMLAEYKALFPARNR